MAAPQIENGFTRIANELIEAVCRLAISGGEMRILFYIIRRTYGFGCISAEITRSSIAEAVCMNEVNVSRAIRKLRDGGIIVQQFSARNGRQILGIQKDYDKWSYMHDKPQKNSLPNDENVHERNNEADDECYTNSDNISNKQKKDKLPVDRSSNKKHSSKTERTSYGRYGNVMLSAEEYGGLLRDYGVSLTDDYIQRLDTHIQAHDKHYARHEPILRQWLERDKVKKGNEFDADKYNFVLNRF